MHFDKELEIHKKIFPLATPEDQLWHLCEELNEMNADENMNEWADSLFVAISLQRFTHTKCLSDMLIYTLYHQYPRAVQKMIDGYLEQAIKKVQSRKYYFVNGRYERDKNV